MLVVIVVLPALAPPGERRGGQSPAYQGSSTLLRVWTIFLLWPHDLSPITNHLPAAMPSRTGRWAVFRPHVSGTAAPRNPQNRSRKTASRPVVHAPPAAASTASGVVKVPSEGTKDGVAARRQTKQRLHAQSSRSLGVRTSNVFACSFPSGMAPAFSFLLFFFVTPLQPLDQRPRSSESSPSGPRTGDSSRAPSLASPPVDAPPSRHPGGGLPHLRGPAAENQPGGAPMYLEDVWENRWLAHKSTARRASINGGLPPFISRETRDRPSRRNRRAPRKGRGSRCRCLAPAPLAAV